MIIGIPKEIMPEERRVSATPLTVRKMIKDGFQVMVQKEAGVGAYFSDEEYRMAGATVEEDVTALYDASDVILKVKEPIYDPQAQCHELDRMQEGQILLAFLHPAAPSNLKMIQDMAKRGIIGLTLDSIPRIIRTQSMDALSSMSVCAGYQGILLAANLLPEFVPPMLSTLGATKPAKVLILGAGVAGLQAVATSQQLGAEIYVMDIRPAMAEQTKPMGAKIIDTQVPPKYAMGEGSTAKLLPEEWLEAERSVIRQYIAEMDIVFCSAHVSGRRAPILVTEDMVQSMRPGSVIVDVSIDQGGNCAISESGRMVVKHGIRIIGSNNLAGMVPTSATEMFAENIYNLLHYLTKDGRIKLNPMDEIVAGILTTMDHDVVHEGAKEAIETNTGNPYL